MELSLKTSIENGETKNIVFGTFNWRVLEVTDGRALLLCEDIIEHRKYSERGKPTTWKQSAVRKYLNSQFVTKFNSAEQNQIIEVENNNLDNLIYKTKGGFKTNDKIFLLSIEEVIKYFGDSGQLNTRNRKDNSIDDEFNELRQVKKDDKPSWWWLRSIGHSNFFASCINNDGHILLYGEFIDYGSVGVRPALWIDLTK